ncbi:MAG: DoxX family protein [Planctomycetota bacterium]
MEWLGWIAQVVVAMGIFNVWLLRFNQSTAYRGGDATNMREEFAAYGLPVWAMYVVGGLKLTLAVLLLVGLWPGAKAVVLPAGLGMTALMVGAVAMHVKAGDPPKRALPAAAMLGLSLVAAFL